MSRRAPVVLKFGGAALSEPARVLERIHAVRAEGAPVVVVVSALAGVTDLLADTIRGPADHRTLSAAVRDLERLHLELPPAGRPVLDRTARLIHQREGRPGNDRASEDRLLSQGERLAAIWLAARLRDAGVAAAPVEADHLGLITDNSYGTSTILLGSSRSQVRRGLGRVIDSGRVPVVTGFFGRSQEGRVAVLGRGGSDYSATAIAAILAAERVELIKRAVAVFTADPRDVPTARPIRWLSYEEAEELAQFGARVLHPLSIEPARRSRVPIVVRPLGRGPATTIASANGHRPVRAIAVRSPLALVHLRLAGAAERPGVAAELTERLAAAGVNLVSLFTSASMLSVVVEPDRLTAGRAALQPMTRGPRGARLEPAEAVALVAAIGRGVTGEVLVRAHRLVARTGGIVATERSISMVVPLGRTPRFVRELHRVVVERHGAD